MLKLRFGYQENDNIDYEFRNQLAAMSKEEKETLLKEYEDLAARQIQEAKALPEKPEMKVRFCVVRAGLGWKKARCTTLITLL